jgi:F-type H+-transporting ATPase subunit delta
MAQKITAHDYAQAMLELAIEPWLKGLRLAERRLRESDVVARLEDKAVPPDEKRKLLTPLLEGVHQPVAAFVHSLVNAGDLNELDTIVDEFESLATRRRQLLLAHVRSAVELNADERAKLEHTLARRFGDTVETEYEVDPSLIGGIVVRVGDEVIDGSLAGRLAALRERLD